MPVIAIDGPSGAGKSTLARALAERLGLDHLDTGAMYRSVALAALRRGVDPSDEEAVADLAPRVRIEVGERILVDGEDATAAIRRAEVTTAVSSVSSNPKVREDMVRRQREWVAARDGAVVEGRDIGTVVLPGADLKVYLTAGGEERARRRSAEMAGSDPEAVAADMARRDEADSTRQSSPLAPADDAVVVDTSDRSVEEVVEEVVRRL